MNHKIKIGTRKSALAMAQTQLVIDRIQEVYPHIQCEIVPIVTKGDKILDKPLLSFGGKGVFVSEFEEALQEGRIDLAIHSAKDMPMDLADGLIIAAVLERADVRDVLIRRKDCCDVVNIVGTSSLRRKTQIEQRYPVTCKDIRGNVGTRLEKLDRGEYDAIVLAAAGIHRLQLSMTSYELEYLEVDTMIPAGGQAIIAIEGREGDEISHLLATISDETTMHCLETERYILRLLEAGCHGAVGVYSKIRGDRIQIVLTSNGIDRYTIEGSVDQRLDLAKSLVNRIKG